MRRHVAASHTYLYRLASSLHETISHPCSGCSSLRTSWSLCYTWSGRLILHCWPPWCFVHCADVESWDMCQQLERKKIINLENIPIVVREWNHLHVLLGSFYLDRVQRAWRFADIFKWQDSNLHAINHFLDKNPHYWFDDSADIYFDISG